MIRSTRQELALDHCTIASCCIACAALASLTACTTNTSPLHTGLEWEVLRDRVRDHLPVGLSELDLKKRIDGLDLEARYELAQESPCDGTPRPAYYTTLRPPGFITTTWPAYITWGKLGLWLDDDDRVGCVAYLPPREGEDRRWRRISP